MRQFQFLFSLALLAGLLLYTACNKDLIARYGARVEVDFSGRVLDEDGYPVANALVEIGLESALTDQNGIFTIRKVEVPERNALVKIRKENYFHFSRAYVVKSEAAIQISIRLLRKDQPAMLNAASGGLISAAGGMSLTFPANGLVDRFGNNFLGQARVFVKPLPADDPNLADKMPGDLRAINSADEEGVLSTFGMIGVELEDDAGNPLKMAQGKYATISMEIPAGLQSVAPATIPLWYYDEERARWIEEGSAQQVNGRYIGEVAHFSFWNCDAFAATVYMEGQVFFQNRGIPIAGAQIRLTVLANGFQGYGTTSGDGWFGGAVPKDYEILLEVLLPDLCGGTVLYSQNIGPFSADVVLPDIIINDPNLDWIDISGALVDCNNNPVTNGYLLLKVNQSTFPLFALADGTFEYHLISCNTATEATLVGYSIDALQQSNPLAILLNGNQSLGTIQVCEGLEEYIQYSLDGQTFSKFDPVGLVNSDYFQVSSSIDSNSVNQNIYLVVQNFEQPGFFPAYRLNVNGLEMNPDVPHTVQVNIETLGSGPGDPMTGSFSGGFTSTNGTSHQISGSYRVLRE